MSDKLLGLTVVVRRYKKHPDIYYGQQGKVVCEVLSGDKKEFIVQFKDGWCFYAEHQLRVVN